MFGLVPHTINTQTDMAALIASPVQLTQLNAPGSAVSLASYDTLRGRDSFALPFTAQMISDLDHLVMVVLSSRLPDNVHQAICAFRLETSRYYDESLITCHRDESR